MYLLVLLYLISPFLVPGLQLNIRLMLTLRVYVCFLFFISSAAFAQKLKKADKAVIDRLKTHVSYLADDRLEGRRAGTSGEKLAMEYIQIQFQHYGLQPESSGGSYFQAFDIPEGKTYDKESSLTINGDKISSGLFFPMPASPERSIQASPSIALKEAKVPWFTDLKETLQAAQANPHFDLSEYLETTAKNDAKKGATALFIYNSDEKADELHYNPKEQAEELSIPVIYVSHTAAKKYFSDETAMLNINADIRFQTIKRTGHNVIGFIDNKAASTVIIGAHYDHLGRGEDGNSMLRTGEKLIHNGADDNASGTAAVIELAGLLKKSKYRNNNYLLIAFSGEELGLFGSKYFTEHPGIDLSKVNYMMNLDMVGRLNDTGKVLTIGGFGTSPWWPQVFSSVSTNNNFTNKYDSSGSGPSDHTSFYRKDIPVLFFFTGLHSDYHKPTDDFDKINYTGEYRIIQYILDLIKETDKMGKLAFTKTREQATASSARFSVTMGIMPDYTFTSRGVRIDGISDGRPAQKAGLKTGDIVIQLGDYPVSSLENYMEALGKFKKGDQTKVKVKRVDKIVEAAIVF